VRYKDFPGSCNFMKQRTLRLVSQRKPGIHEKPTLSIWQSGVLAYANAKCGTKFTSIEQIENWLRKNSHSPPTPDCKGRVRSIAGRATKRRAGIPPAPPPPAAA
jgi:hypothetical protein